MPTAPVRPRAPPCLSCHRAAVSRCDACSNDQKLFVCDDPVCFENTHPSNATEHKAAWWRGTARRSGRTTSAGPTRGLTSRAVVRLFGACVPPVLLARRAHGAHHGFTDKMGKAAIVCGPATANCNDGLCCDAACSRPRTSCAPPLPPHSLPLTATLTHTGPATPAPPLLHPDPPSPRNHTRWTRTRSRASPRDVLRRFVHGRAFRVHGPRDDSRQGRHGAVRRQPEGVLQTSSLPSPRRLLAACPTGTCNGMTCCDPYRSPFVFPLCFLPRCVALRCVGLRCVCVCICVPLRCFAECCVALRLRCVALSCVAFALRLRLRCVPLRCFAERFVALRLRCVCICVPLRCFAERCVALRLRCVCVCFALSCVALRCVVFVPPFFPPHSPSPVPLFLPTQGCPRDDCLPTGRQGRKGHDCLHWHAAGVRRHDLL